MTRRRLTNSEIYRLVYDYIGVDGGYLGGFTYRTHAEFYPYYCDLDIDPYQYEGTTRERFMQILSEASPSDQAKILKGVFKKYPLSGSLDSRQDTYNEFLGILSELDANVSEDDPLVNRVIEILAYKGRHDLASLLKGCWHDINQSNTYGSRYYSYLSTLEIYVPITRHEKFEALSASDHEAIISAFHVPYPVKDHEIEINHVEFFIDPNSKLPNSPRKPLSLDHIDFDFITQQIAKCDDKILHGDFEGAITNARSLIEAICKYVLEGRNVQYDGNSDLPELYKAVAKELNMHPEEHVDKPLKQILGGCFSIVNGLGAIRNKLSDAHGQSPKKRYKPLKRHAAFAVASSKALADFIYASYLENPKKRMY